MKHSKGFTLIEILIALTVFAILAAITSSTLYHAFTTRTRVNEQSDRLSTLQLAISFLQQDTRQIINRAVRANDLHLRPIFHGEKDYVEFTRDGEANPRSIAKKSTLKRVAYVCEENTLKRRTWNTLDMPDHSIHQDKILVSQLDSCDFAYLNQNLQLFPEWRADAVNEDQNKEFLPKAIQVNLTISSLGTINLLFPIPESLYATS